MVAVLFTSAGYISRKFEIHFDRGYYTNNPSWLVVVIMFTGQGKQCCIDGLVSIAKSLLLCFFMVRERRNFIVHEY